MSGRLMVHKTLRKLALIARRNGLCGLWCLVGSLREWLRLAFVNIPWLDNVSATQVWSTSNPAMLPGNCLQIVIFNKSPYGGPYNLRFYPHMRAVMYLICYSGIMLLWLRQGFKDARQMSSRRLKDVVWPIHLGSVGPIRLGLIGPIHLSIVGPIHLGPFGPWPLLGPFIWAPFGPFIWGLLGPFIRALLGPFGAVVLC